METNYLAVALCKAQAQMGKAEESGKNPRFNSTYSTYEDLMNAARKPLSENGLTVLQYIDHIDNVDYIITKLRHTSGQEEVSKARVYLSDVTDVQKLGSFMTYIQRYNLAGMCGIVANLGDDDGNSLAKKKEVKEDFSGGNSSVPARQPAPDVSDKYPAQGQGTLSQKQINFIVNLMKGDRAKELEICKRLNINSLEFIPSAMANGVLAFLGFDKARNEKNFIPLPEAGSSESSFDDQFMF